MLTEESGYQEYWSKYVVKPGELEDFYTGRTWGIIGKLPLRQGERFTMTEAVKTDIQRFVRRYLHAKQKIKKKGKDGTVKLVRPRQRYEKRLRKRDYEGFVLIKAPVAMRMLELAFERDEEREQERQEARWWA